MINPPALALRRRADELHAAATREQTHDPDAAALLLFYAAECGLKSIYMVQNNLKNTAETRGGVPPARSYIHDILRLSDAIRVPKSVYAPNPSFLLSRTRTVVNVAELHQAWRYGERLEGTDVIYAWLLRLFDWIKKNR